MGLIISTEEKNALIQCQSDIRYKYTPLHVLGFIRTVVNLKTSHWMEFVHPMAIIKTNDYVQTIFNY